MTRYSLIDWLIKIIRRPGFWFITAIFVFITILHYGEIQAYPGILTRAMADLNLSRHAFERIFYMAPVVWAGFLFGWRGAFISSLVALSCMLPRAIFISQSPLDALLETGSVFLIGNALSISFVSLRKEREYRIRLEIAQQGLRSSEQRYRQLFENAHDAILLHNLEGNIIAVNSAAEKLTGYNAEELSTMNVGSFLSDESLQLASQIRRKLLANEPVEQPYEQRFIKKDGSEVFVQLATSMLFDNGKPSAFQHIARDITEQKKMQENLRFYVQQATKAQEEERRRISRELHDDTIQALVVLSRQLDSLASEARELTEDSRQRLEQLWQQTNTIIQEVRRLSQDMRPDALDRLGLLPALEWLASKVEEYSGIATKVKVHGSERRLPEELELVLFRISQEALRNIWRHSQATEAKVVVQFEDAVIQVNIRDNGKGFKLSGNIGDLARDGKLGLAGMQERIRLVGGSLKIDSKPGKGTTVAIEAPI